MIVDPHLLDPAAPADPAAVPYVDDGGLLRLGGSWVAIPDAQLPVLELLLERYDRVVRTEELAERYAEAGGSGSPGAVATMLRRLGDRVARLGLQLVTIRDRGQVLTLRLPLLGPAGFA